ncbi:MAG: MFS transporter [Candidatus Aenigmatarchaeota archaeon]
MNRTIKLLIVSDIFGSTGFGLVGPILAIFIKDNLAGGTIFAAGFASMLFLLTKSAVQLPFSRHVDKSRDKVKWLIVGTLIISVVPFVYIFATDVSHIYLAEMLLGLGNGLAFPAWLGLWSTNLDKGHESFEWSLYSTLTGLGAAVTAAIGAAIAQFVGFAYTFVMVGIMSLAGCGILLRLEMGKNAKEKVKAAGKAKEENAKNASS